MPAAKRHRTDSIDAIPLTPGRETTRLRLLFLAPLTVVIIAGMLLFLLELYSHQQEKTESGVVRIHMSAVYFFSHSIQYNADVLITLLDVIGRDEALRAALKEKDRAKLLERAAPIYADLNRNYGITHLYFTGPDHGSLLRAHRSERVGGRIERFTTREAERTGKMAYGLELGSTGMFTLRVVSPWYDDETPSQKRRLIGFVELGIEIDNMLQLLEDLMGVRLFIVISKRFLDQNAWETGMKELGRVSDWDRFPDVALTVSGMSIVPPALARKFAANPLTDMPEQENIAVGQTVYRGVSVPLYDAPGRNVGRMVILSDVSRDVEIAQQTLRLGVMTTLVAGGSLFGFFWWLVGRIGRRLEFDEQKLREMATRDGLTGLFNHRMFYSILERETARARRHNRSVSLLMLDIDHFKRVNDTYGHRAGDRILEGLGAVISRQARVIDSVCRYGGEEITVILPEAVEEDAAIAAERLRVGIEQHGFDIKSDRQVTLTVSIGVATFPAHATSTEELVTAADRALYAAKEGGRNRVCRAGNE